MLEDLKKEVYNLYNPDTKLSLNEYNNLIKLCVDINEMAAVVFIYDNMIENKISPDKNTYNLINKLHSKIIKESNNIYIKNQNIGKLNPRRRIHKIIKGYNYSNNYNKALVNVNKVKEYIELNSYIKEFPRIKLAKLISKNCLISFDDARYIITYLKKTKFLNNSLKNIEDFSKILNTTKSNKVNELKQNNITNYF